MEAMVEDINYILGDDPRRNPRTLSEFEAYGLRFACSHLQDCGRTIGYRSQPDPDESAFAGHLHVITTSAQTDFLRRFVVLSSNTLFVFASSASPEIALDSFSFPNSAVVVPNSSRFSGNQHAFEIVDGRRIWILATTSQSSKDSWIVMIQMQISRAPSSRQIFYNAVRNPRLAAPTAQIKEQKVVKNSETYAQERIAYLKSLEEKAKVQSERKARNLYRAMSQAAFRESASPVQYESWQMYLAPSPTSTSQQDAAVPAMEHISKPSGVDSRDQRPGGNEFANNDSGLGSSKKERKTDLASWLKELY
ncbi:hypothetical protein HDU83_002544 [Entophlyctis luteolus]|nr:hypothetical protein HDU83_002544 [Entophlyctis luteolus]